jgi:crotonobetainyl-CoA:carnitine CoA-transferase CaiB-like acyl-CoA transferase
MSSDTTDTTPRPPMLDGVKVVDLTQYLSGPTVTRLMAEMGADIVKIEQPPYGDPIRGLAMITDGRSGYFVQQNRGKKSVCVDMNTTEGREVLDRIIAEADVLVENYGPGVLERRGLDYASIAEKHPRLIYASISGFGRTGSYSHKTCFDLIAQSYSGMVALTGDEDGAPMPVGSSYADVTSGVHAFAAIGMALFHRERTGRGGKGRRSRRASGLQNAVVASHRSTHRRASSKARKAGLPSKSWKRSGRASAGPWSAPTSKSTNGSTPFGFAAAIGQS